MSSVLTALRIGKVLKVADLVQIILDLLNASWGPILDEILHSLEGLVDAAPLLGARIQFLPQVSHNLVVLVPTRCLSCQAYQLYE